ncbi:ACT domain containing protein, putative [Angomonas deanei]|uniref:ACT domain containing protein, putative n=1 Tax=Angomonas deanei TaxID=59799 RepID=A0A7G2CFG3_9TRYP|nr:ACT domain containing protein, putative [Angomonas deanei]
MSGVTDLNDLMKGMSPELENCEYVFLTLQQLSSYTKEEKNYIMHLAIDEAVATFREEEGLTVVLSAAFAKKNVFGDNGETPARIRKEWIEILGSLDTLSTMKRITMKIHSSLTAVGFTAAFSKVLTEANISCNVFAGYYHDHIFVPTKDAERAMQVLTDVIKSAKENSH